MCTKTKTTWGCGCAAKDREPIPCDDAKRYGSFCPDIERFVMKRDGDCRDCRENPDPYGPGMRGEGRYAQEIRREQMREHMRGAGDDSYGRRNPRPTGRHESTRSRKPRENGARKSSSGATDDDEPEEIEVEYTWDSPSTTGRNKRSKIKDEDVDIVVDLTPPESDSREHRRKERRSSMPSRDYPAPGRSEYERSRDEYYQSKGPRISKRYKTHRTSPSDGGTGSRFEFVERMRDHCRPSRKSRDPDPDEYGYRHSYRSGDIDDFDLDPEFDDHDDIAFDFDMSPGLMSERMRSHFPRSRSHRDGFMDSFFSRRDDDFFDRGFRY